MCACSMTAGTSPCSLGSHSIIPSCLIAAAGVGSSGSAHILKACHTLLRLSLQTQN